VSEYVDGAAVSARLLAEGIGIPGVEGIGWPAEGDSDEELSPSVTPISAVQETLVTGVTVVTPETVTSNSPRHRRTGWTADELMAHVFPPPRWAVPELVAEGLTLLAGPPKVGKSWLSLGLALDVARGGRALGYVDVEQGDVLYLALEDTGRRLQSRLRTLLGGHPAPRALTLATACERMPEGSARIRKWLDEHPGARLVVVDVLARVRPGQAPGAPAYQADYTALAGLKTVADDYGVAVLVVHHTRKAAADDWVDTISGTHGIAGAADAIMVLSRSRGQADAALSITGRDVDETSHALAFTTGRWTRLDGPAVDNLIGDTRAAILGYVRAHPGIGPTKIAEGTGLGKDLVKRTVRRMVDDGQLADDGRGHYTAAAPGDGQLDLLGDDPAERDGVGGDTPTVTPVTPVTKRSLPAETEVTPEVTAVTPHPLRVRYRRGVKGWSAKRDLPADHVYVGRFRNGTRGKWGNAHRCDGQPCEMSECAAAIHTAAEAVALHRQWITSQPEKLAETRAELAGRHLACYCPLDEPCHADTLAEIANENDDVPTPTDGSVMAW
jgi:hypothetical protein